ncbi:hypothetical protein NDN08_001513 [Rhodosorus marinus]|uniref:SWIM-type domain-containing protein n=1 Tax=Rhodosorus marinus TaxID=101924 RepID=A0AAV8UR32_9RHOD|nr:hypothetical protein NDN08_001513 [Rhodosorus marinus]
MAKNSRYGKVTNLGAEELNRILEGNRERGHLTIISRFVQYVGVSTYKRQVECRAMEQKVPDAVMQTFQQRIRTIRVQRLEEFGGGNIKVVEDAGERLVSLMEGTCTCGEFQILRFPCPHAAACIEEMQVDPTSFMNETYHVRSLRGNGGTSRCSRRM